MRAIHFFVSRAVICTLLALGLIFITSSCIVTTPVRTERVVVVKKKPPGHQHHHHHHHGRGHGHGHHK